MRKLFLTSSIGTPGVAASVRAKIGGEKPLKTAFITTPVEPESEQDDLSWYETDRKALRSAGFDFFDYTVTGKTKEDFEHDLEGIDALYVTGGNTPYLLQESQKSGFIDFTRTYVASGKTYVSTSAGSIIAGPVLPSYLLEDGEDTPKLTDLTCYNLVNFTVLPHWGSSFFKDKYLENRMEVIYHPDGPSYVLLNDSQYVEVRDDSYRIIDVAKK